VLRQAVQGGLQAIAVAQCVAALCHCMVPMNVWQSVAFLYQPVRTLFVQAPQNSNQACQSLSLSAAP